MRFLKSDKFKLIICDVLDFVYSKIRWKRVKSKSESIKNGIVARNIRHCRLFYDDYDIIMRNKGCSIKRTRGASRGGLAITKVSSNSRKGA